MGMEQGFSPDRSAYDSGGSGKTIKEVNKSIQQKAAKEKNDQAEKNWDEANKRVEKAEEKR